MVFCLLKYRIITMLLLLYLLVSRDHVLLDLTFPRVLDILKPPPPPRATVSETLRRFEDYIRAEFTIASLRAAIRKGTFPPYFESVAGKEFLRKSEASLARAGMMVNPANPKAAVPELRMKAINPYTPLPPISHPT